MPPISYDIDEPRRLIRARATGVLTDDDILAHKSELAADPRVTPEMRELSDVRGVERLDVTPAGIHQMVWSDREKGTLPPGRRLAIVVSSDVAFGLGRMYQLQTSPDDAQVRIFRDLGEATLWLGVER